MADNGWVADESWQPDAGERTWGDVGRSALQTVDDGVRAAANAVTFGMADRFAGAMPGGGGTDAEVRRSEEARKRSPYASIAGDVGGSLALPGFGAEALAARMGGGLAARAGAYGLTGAGTGAAQGAGTTYSGNLPDYVNNAAVGGVMGGVLGAAGGALFGRGPATARTPTLAEQRQATTQAYDRLRQSDAMYDGNAFGRRAQAVERRFADDYLTPREASYAFRGIDDMHRTAQGTPGIRQTVTPSQMDWIRKGVNRAYDDVGPAARSEQEGARTFNRSLDDFVINPPPGAVIPGFEQSAAEAAQIATRARALNAAKERMRVVEDMTTRAMDTTGATHSGLNFQNEMRKQYRGLLRPDKRGRSDAQREGFDQGEIAAMRGFTRGGSDRMDNFYRWAQKAGGGGGGLGFTVTSGIMGTAGGTAGHYFKDDPALGSALGVGIPLAATLATMHGNRRAQAATDAIRDRIAQRNPLFNPNAGTVPGYGYPRVAKGTRDAVTLEMLKQDPGDYLVSREDGVTRIRPNDGRN